MYLVVISYCEEETYFFKTKKEMLEYFEVKTIKQLLNENNRIFSQCNVYKVSKVFKGE